MAQLTKQDVAEVVEEILDRKLDEKLDKKFDEKLGLKPGETLDDKFDSLAEAISLMDDIKTIKLAVKETNKDPRKPRKKNRWFEKQF